jgi:hypothetical protein
VRTAWYDHERIKKPNPPDCLEFKEAWTIMTAIAGIYKNGQIILDAPADWPEGCRVIVEPAPAEETLGIREEDWPDTPEGIAAWLRWYDSLEPIERTPQEEAEWQAVRKEQREHEKAKFEEWSEKLREMWE